MTKIHFSFQAFLAVLLVFVAHNTWSQKHSLDLKGGLMQTQTGFNATIVFVDVNGNEIGATSTPSSYTFMMSGSILGNLHKPIH